MKYYFIIILAIAFCSGCTKTIREKTWVITINKNSIKENNFHEKIKNINSEDIDVLRIKVQINSDFDFEKLHSYLMQVYMLCRQSRRYSGKDNLIVILSGQGKDIFLKIFVETELFRSKRIALQDFDMTNTNPADQVILLKPNITFSEIKHVFSVPVYIRGSSTGRLFYLPVDPSE